MPVRGSGEEVMELGKKIAAWTCGVMALAVVVGWSATARADDDVKVRFSWKLKGEYGPLYMAQAKVFFTANKLNVRLGEGAGAPAALGALLQGQEDVVILPGIF